MSEYDEQEFVDYEETDTELSIDDVTVDEDLNMTDEEAFAYKILRRAASLRAVTIKRDVFLRTELSKYCPPSMVAAAVKTSPYEAGIPMDIVDTIADAAISLELRKTAGLSALAGLPGGLAIFGTIPADLAQYFAHSLRIEQKLAYIYGWQSFLDDKDEIDDDTMYRLIMFLGIMMQVGGVGTTITKFAQNTARQTVSKTIERQALTKTAWYNPMKSILRHIGIKVTKNSFAETVSKGVPIIGGAISGGITYATFKPEATRLKLYLRCLTPATGVPVSDEEAEQIEKRVLEETKSDFSRALDAATETVGQKAAEIGFTSERAAEVADTAKNVAGDAARGFRRGLDGFRSRFASTSSPTTPSEPEPVVNPPAAEEPKSQVDLSAAADQLRVLKGLLDDGIITQDDFDAKKKELLGL